MHFNFISTQSQLALVFHLFKQSRNYLSGRMKFIGNFRMRGVDDSVTGKIGFGFKPFFQSVIQLLKCNTINGLKQFLKPCLVAFKDKMFP